MWNLIAKVLAKPKFVSWLRRYACTHGEGDHLYGYMNRWWLTPRNWGFGPLAFPAPVWLRLHEIITPDLGRDMHDHPWDFRSIILKGAYTELDAFGLPRVYGEGETLFRRAQDAHRLSQLHGKGRVVTLIVGYRWRQVWGFYTKGANGDVVKVAWRAYLSSPERAND